MNSVILIAISILLVIGYSLPAYAIWDELDIDQEALDNTRKFETFLKPLHLVAIAIGAFEIYLTIENPGVLNILSLCTLAFSFYTAYGFYEMKNDLSDELN